MKNNVKKALLATFATMSMGLIATAFTMQPVKTTMAETVTIPTQYTMVEEDAGFAMRNGASVRKSTAAIRFSTDVTKAYYETLTAGGAEVEFIATMSANGKTEAVEFTMQPNFENGDTYTLYTYLNFADYQQTATPEQLRTAYETEFIANTYAKVTTGTTTTYYQAYKTGDYARSMQVVANAAYLNGETDLEHYFASMDKSDAETAYVLKNGSGSITLPTLTGDTYVGAYIGTDNVTGTITGNKIALTGVDVTDVQSGDTMYVSAFTDQGKVVTRKLVVADKAITASNVADLLTTTTGYVVVVEDINMATAYTANSGVWNNTDGTGFNGTLNGMGHTISNLNTITGLFRKFSGTIKNIAIVDTHIGASTKGVIAGWQIDASPITVENSLLHVKTVLDGGYRIGTLLGQCSYGATITVKDSVLYNAVTGNHTVVGYLSHSDIKVSFENTSLVGPGTKASKNSSLSADVDTFFAGSVDTYANTDAFTTAYLGGEVKGISSFITNSLLTGVTMINSSNIATLLTATSGTYILTEDIDMATAYTANGGVWDNTNGTGFNGTLIGNGHTISNLNTTTGLFRKFSGTIKDIAIVNVHIGANERGVIAAWQIDASPVTVENVVIHIKSVLKDGYRIGTLIGKCSHGATITVKDSVLYNEAEGNHTTVGFISNAGLRVVLNNCYLIGPGTRASKNSTLSDGLDTFFSGTYTACANAEEFTTAYGENTVTGLSNFVLGVMGISVVPAPTVETTSAVSSYQIVVSKNATTYETAAANLVKDFFTAQQA